MLARQELLRNQTESIESIYKKIDQVNVEAIQKVANEIFGKDKFYTTTIGPFPDYEKFVKSQEIN
jgi:predicted Zn-dependent peptidase